MCTTNSSSRICGSSSILGSNSKSNKQLLLPYYFSQTTETIFQEYNQIYTIIDFFFNIFFITIPEGLGRWHFCLIVCANFLYFFEWTFLTDFNVLLDKPGNMLQMYWRNVRANIFEAKFFQDLKGSLS